MSISDSITTELLNLFVQLRELKKEIIVLEEKSVYQNQDLQQKSCRAISDLLNSLQRYSGHELSIFLEHDVSLLAVNLLKRIKAVFNNQDLRKFFSGEHTFNDTVLATLKQEINNLSEAEHLLQQLISDEKFLEKQKKKALALAKPELKFTEKGCYHFTHGEKLRSIFSLGLQSLESAEKSYGIAIDLAMDGLQGPNFVSVFDPYSYWRLYLTMKSDGLLKKILEDKIITKEEFAKIMDGTPDINLSKNRDINLDLLDSWGLFRRTQKETLAKYFWYTFLTINEGKMDYLDGWFDPPVLGKVCIFIDDTAPFFPLHDNAYEFEATFQNSISVKK